MASVAVDRHRRSVRLALVACGIGAGSAQVLLARELLGVLYGNELCLGAVLGGWLLCGALGGLLASRSKAAQPPAVAWRLGLLQVLTPVLLLLSLVAVRAIPLLVYQVGPAASARLGADSALARFVMIALAANPGEIIGLLPALLFAGLAGGPMAALFGAQFVLASRLWTSGLQQAGAELGRAYVWEACGDFIGAGLLSLVFVHRVDPFLLAMLGSVPVVYAAYVLERRVIWPGRSDYVRAGGFAFGPPTEETEARAPEDPEGAGGSKQRGAETPSGPALAGKGGRFRASLGWYLLLAFMLGVAWRPLAQWSQRVRWTGYHPVAEVSSVHGRITVTQSGSITSFYQNGLLLFDCPNPERFQELVHYPLLAHPDPRRVLLIGGGVGGGLTEVLRHRPQQVTYAELDPKLIEVARSRLKPQYVAPLEDPRVKLYLGDGRLLVRELAARNPRQAERFDVVLLLVPDPQTAQLNRFYTEEFFREVGAILRPEGLVALHIASSEGFLSPELARFDACLVRTLGQSLRVAGVMPGEQALIVGARPGAKQVTLDPDIVEQRRRRRGIELPMIFGMLPYKLDPFKRDMFWKAVREAPPVPINTDLHPVSYYYGQVLWATWYHPGARRFLNRLGRVTVGQVLAGVVVLLGLAALAVGRGRPGATRVGFAAAAGGMAGLVLEFVLLLGFQTVYGYVYHKIGIIVGTFMIGLAAGAWWAARYEERRGVGIVGLAGANLAIAGLAVATPGILMLLSTAGATWANLLGAQVVFPLLTGIVGVVVGGMYPFATAALTAGGMEAGRATGLVYAADLLGGCLGALVASAVLVPILGIGATCGVVAALNGLAALLAVAGRRPAPPA